MEFIRIEDTRHTHTHTHTHTKTIETLEGTEEAEGDRLPVTHPCLGYNV